MIIQQRYALTVLMLAGFITIFDLFVVNVAIVSIENSLHASLTALTLIIVLYELGFGLLLITGGRLGDLYGQRTLYQVGMGCFMLSSLFCALSPTSEWLIFSRLLQGLSAALLFPQVYASIRHNFDDAQTKTAFAYLGMSLGLAAIAGQVLGGLLIELDLFGLSWRSIFLINLPIGILALFLSAHLKDYRLTGSDLGLDILGVLLSSLTISFSLWPILMLPASGWNNTSSLLLLLGGVCGACFIRHEIKHKQQAKVPLLDVSLFSNRRFFYGVLTILGVYSTASAFPFMMAILFQRGLELSAFHSGLLFMPASIGFVGASLLTPHWQRRWGNRILLIGALCYAGAYLILMIMVGGFLWTHPIWIFLPIQLLIGFTQGMVMTPIINRVLASVDVELIGMASGLTATIQQIGAALGVTVVGNIFQSALVYYTTLDTTHTIEKSFAISLSFNIFVILLATITLRKIK